MSTRQQCHLFVWKSPNRKCFFLVEVIGYLCRIISSYQSPDWTLPPFAIETVFILVAPAFFSASIYMLLGRIMVLVDGESKSIIKRTWLTKIFVCGDVLSLLLQAAGQ